MSNPVQKLIRSPFLTTFTFQLTYSPLAQTSLMVGPWPLRLHIIGADLSRTTNSSPEEGYSTFFWQKLFWKQGPDLRYLRRAIWRRRDFWIWRIWVLALWPLKWPWRFIMGNGLELRQNNQIWNLVRIWMFWRSWIFGLLALKMALKVNSDHKFKLQF